MNMSPAISFLRTSLAGNTFALYINGRRRQVAGVSNSPGGDADDPYRVYARAPRPLDPNARRDFIEKTGRVEQGTAELASATITNKLIRNILGEGQSLGSDGMYEADTWLGMPGTSHFRLLSDERRRPYIIVLELYDQNLQAFGSSVSIVVEKMQSFGYKPLVVNESGSMVPFSGELKPRYYNVFFSSTMQSSQ